MHGAARWAWRVAVFAAGVAVAGVAVWGVWVLPGQRLVAAAGFGRVDGVVTVERCFETVDAEGNDAGISCQGSFTPRGLPGHSGHSDDGAGTGGGAGAGTGDGTGTDAARPILLKDAAKSHPAGARREVQLIGGDAFEPSTPAFLEYGVAALLLLSLACAPVGWLLQTAWRGRVGSEGFFLVLFFGPLVALVGGGAVLIAVVGVRALF